MPLLGHPEEFDLAHRAFRLGDGLLHRRDSPLGFLDGPLECFALLGDDGQQLLAQALHSAVAGRLDELTAGALNKLVKRRKQFSPIPLRPPVFEALRGADFKDRPHGTLQTFFQNLLGEPYGRCSFRIGGAVGLVEHQDEILNLPPHGLNQRQFLARQRRIRAHHHQGGVNVGDEGLSGRRIAREHRP